MSGDISDSAKIGIGVLLLCFLIGIVFNVFTMVRSTATKGTNQLQGSMNQMVDATYAAYDNETVFGTSVINAISTYGQDKMCIVVDNRNNAPVSPNGGPNGLSGVSINKPTGLSNFTGGNVGEAYYYGYPLSSGLTYDVSIGNFLTSTLNVNGTRSLDSSPTKVLGDPRVYVNTQNRYSSYLIKDSTAQIIGVYFQLQK